MNREPQGSEWYLSNIEQIKVLESETDIGVDVMLELISI